MEDQNKSRKKEKKMKIYYENILVGEVITNQSLNVAQALELIDFDEFEFEQLHGFEIDYNDFKLKY